MSAAPILFSAPMICALIAGTKSETRRLQPPRWKAGDFLPVREAFKLGADYDALSPSDWEALSDEAPEPFPVHYMADGEAPDAFGKGRPSIHMPRSISRLTLRVVSVHSEPLHQIDNEAAFREGVVMVRGQDDGGPKYGVEGVPEIEALTAAKAYLSLWDHINGQGSAASNPKVYVTAFEVLRINIDRFPGMQQADPEETPMDARTHSTRHRHGH